MQTALGIPIYDSENTAVGVMQAINKVRGRPFTDGDLDRAEAFSIFCGLGLHNCLLYERLYSFMAQQKVCIDLLSYHATSSKAEVQNLLNITIPPGE